MDKENSGIFISQNPKGKELYEKFGAKKSEDKTSYSLDEKFLDLLNGEFNVNDMAQKYASAIEGKKAEEADEIGRNLFEEYGINFAKRILENESTYRDRTAGLIYELAERTGHVFPNVPQRMIEIALFSTRPDDKWRWNSINVKRLAYTVATCGMNQALIDFAGEEVANRLPCRHYCVKLSETVYEALNLDVRVKMTAELPKDGHCQFDGFSHSP